jgi:hypothetical protein
MAWINGGLCGIRRSREAISVWRLPYFLYGSGRRDKRQEAIYRQSLTFSRQAVENENRHEQQVAAKRFASEKEKPTLRLPYRQDAETDKDNNDQEAKRCPQIYADLHV